MYFQHQLIILRTKYRINQQLNLLHQSQKIIYHQIMYFLPSNNIIEKLHFLIQINQQSNNIIHVKIDHLIILRTKQRNNQKFNRLYQSPKIINHQIMYFQHQIITLNNFIFFNLNQLFIKQYYRITSFLNLNQLIIKQYYTCQNRPFNNLTNKVKKQSKIQSSVLIPKNYKPSNNVFLTSNNNIEQLYFLILINYNQTYYRTMITLINYFLTFLQSHQTLRYDQDPVIKIKYQ
eukprot:TRINITY_DN3436_c0_g1_i8.p1 TRINITY_DN3436_c0_g1~~TRINITY_DN3436_c0_g1_i8.p1  ORF type:complete len:233 (+),score=-39.99 TRINITY_DN3436_c0_g1_i8:363-1061(+)